MRLTPSLSLLAMVAGLVLPFPAAEAQTAEQPGGTGTVVEASQHTGTNVVESTIRRDPFWPVGYVPKEALPVVTNTVPEVEEPVIEEEPEVVIEWPELSANGSTRTPEGTYYAFLDGIGMVEEGDVVQKEHKAVVFTWHVERITKDGAELRRVSAEPKTGH